MLAAGTVILVIALFVTGLIVATRPIVVPLNPSHDDLIAALLVRQARFRSFKRTAGTIAAIALVVLFATGSASWLSTVSRGSLITVAVTAGLLYVIALFSSDAVDAQVAMAREVKARADRERS